MISTFLILSLMIIKCNIYIFSYKGKKKSYWVYKWWQAPPLYMDREDINQYFVKSMIHIYWLKIKIPTFWKTTLIFTRVEYVQARRCRWYADKIFNIRPSYEVVTLLQVHCTALFKAQGWYIVYWYRIREMLKHSLFRNLFMYWSVYVIIYCYPAIFTCRFNVE